MTGVSQSSTVDSATAEERKRFLGNLLAEREAQRQAEAAAKNERKQQEKAEHESQDTFASTFYEEHNKITHALESIRTGATDDTEMTVSTLQSISAQIDLLLKYLNESTNYLPVRSMEHYRTQLSGLQSSVSEIRESLVPRKKFAFRSKPKKTETAAKQPKPISEAGKRKKKDEDSTNCFSITPLLDNVINQTLKLEKADTNCQDVVLQNLKDSNIKILGHPATLHLLNVVNCEILVGPCSTSVFLDKCVNSTVVLACQQLRCHSVSNCRLYVHITSRGIIEDCNQVQFAPFSLKYDSLDEDFVAANLPQNRNNWNKIDDFNWLSKTEQSPNYSLIPENERRSFTA